MYDVVNSYQSSLSIIYFYFLNKKDIKYIDFINIKI